jgi:hypothetical protein
MHLKKLKKHYHHANGEGGEKNGTFPVFWKSLQQTKTDALRAKQMILVILTFLPI